MVKRHPDGRIVRPPRERTPEFDLTTPDGVRAMGLFYLNRIAEITGFCMTDHLNDQTVIRDMHEINGDIGALVSTIHILHRRLTEALAEDAESKRFDAAVDWLLNSRHTGDPDIQTEFWAIADGLATPDVVDALSAAELRELRAEHPDPEIRERSIWWRGRSWH